MFLDAKVTNDHSMVSKKVGTLDRLYDKSLVARHGGILQNTSMNATLVGDEVLQMKMLARLMHEKKLDGVLIDRYTYRHMEQKLRNVSEPAMYHLLHKTLITPVSDSGRKVSYGLLFRSKKYRGELKHPRTWLYEAMKDILEEKRVLFQLNVAKSFQKFLQTSENESNDFYKYALVENVAPVCITVAVMLLLGVVYEIRRRRALRE